MNVPCCAYMTNLLFTNKVKVNIKVTKRQNLAQSIILAHFKGIFAEVVKLMFTMFLGVHMRIFYVVFYMIDFLNCIQSGGRTSKAALNASKHIFPRIQGYIYTFIVVVMP